MSKKIDPDILALKQARKALLKSTSNRMLKANLDYLMDYFILHPPQEISLPNNASSGRGITPPLILSVSPPWLFKWAEKENVMPENYEKPEYKSNEDKYREAERNAPPPDRSGQRVGDSDHVKMPDVEYKPNVPKK